MTKIAPAWITLVALSFAPTSAICQDDPSPANAAYEAFSAGDFKKAHDLWLAGARMGDPNSQFNLGYLYETGQGVAANYETAYAWYSEAANNQCRMAECNLANMHSKGMGVDVNYNEAINRLARCIRPGGVCREQIVAMREMVQKGLVWYSEQGYADAEYQLAQMALGRGNWSESAAWLQKAAQRGHGLSQVALAEAYLRGDGVELDRDLGARMMFEAIIQHRADPRVLKSAKSGLAMAYHGWMIESSRPHISAYVWASLARADIPEPEAFMGLLHDATIAEATKALTDHELGTADLLVSRWDELFADGLPGVAEHHLQTLILPPQ